MNIDVGITTITCLVLLSICILIRTELKSIIKSIKEKDNKEDNQTTSTFTTCTECMHDGNNNSRLFYVIKKKNCK